MHEDALYELPAPLSHRARLLFGRARAVASSGDHAVVLLTNGALLAAGAAEAGQCGPVASPRGSAAPLYRVPLPPSVVVTAVAVGAGSR